MYTLLEYLIARKQSHILKISINLIVTLSAIVALWAWHDLNNKILSKIPHKILWSILLIMVSIVIILYSYIRYTYNQNNIKFILKNYTHDKKYGIPIHKKKNYRICPKCLINHKIEYQVQERDNYCICSTCKEEYSINKPNWGDLWNIQTKDSNI